MHEEGCLDSCWGKLEATTLWWCMSCDLARSIDCSYGRVATEAEYRHSKAHGPPAVLSMLQLDLWSVVKVSDCIWTLGMVWSAIHSALKLKQQHHGVYRRVVWSCTSSTTPPKP